jgi:hypothetical protein
MSYKLFNVQFPSLSIIYIFYSTGVGWVVGGYGLLAEINTCICMLITVHVPPLYQALCIVRNIAGIKHFYITKKVSGLDIFDFERTL